LKKDFDDPLHRDAVSDEWSDVLAWMGVEGNGSPHDVEALPVGRLEAKVASGEIGWHGVSLR